jgi:hypothetical protein
LNVPIDDAEAEQLLNKWRKISAPIGVTFIDVLNSQVSFKFRGIVSDSPPGTLVVLGNQSSFSVSLDGASFRSSDVEMALPPDWTMGDTFVRCLEIVLPNFASLVLFEIKRVN